MIKVIWPKRELKKKKRLLLVIGKKSWHISRQEAWNLQLQIRERLEK